MAADILFLALNYQLFLLSQVFLDERGELGDVRPFVSREFFPQRFAFSAPVRILCVLIFNAPETCMFFRQLAHQVVRMIIHHIVLIVILINCLLTILLLYSIYDNTTK